MAIERFTAPLITRLLQLGASGVPALFRQRVATLAAHDTLTVTSAPIQVLDPGGAGRNVTLPAEAQSEFLGYVIVNTADLAEALTVKDDGGSTVVTIGQNESGVVHCDGTTWRGMVFPSAGNAGAYMLGDGTVTGATAQAQAFTLGLNVDAGIDHDVALTAAGDGQNTAVTINHATDSTEGLDVAVTQLTTPRTSGTVAAIKAATTSLAGDSGGVYAAVQATHTDGGGSAKHFGILVDSTSDAAVGSADSTAGGASAATAPVVIKTGDRIKNDADAGVPASGAVTVQSGDASVTAAATGGASGAVILRSGATDSTDAGGTGGNSGFVTVQSGDAASTAGTSGNSGNVTITSGASADGTSGDVVIKTGAGATKGTVRATDILTTTDGVVAGDARRIGGRAAVITASGTAHTGSTDEAVLASYSIPANTIKAGTAVRVRFMARVTADNAGTTLTGRLRFGATTLTGTELIVSSAVDTSSGHVFTGEFTLFGRAAPGAAAEVVGVGSFSEPGAAGGAVLSAALVPGTNFATNAALLLELTGDWSAADANSVQAECFMVEVIG